MAHIIGHGRKQLLQQRRSPLDPARLICTVCSSNMKPVFMRKVRTYDPIEEIHRPGVMCPKCKALFVEQEYQPEV